MSSLPEKIVAIHRALAAHQVPHAFGGALALAWCTQRARGTIDIDLNLFVGPERAADTVAALPAGVVSTPRDLALLERDGQARLWWDGTPIDAFLNTTDFHDDLARRVHDEPFLGEPLPFLSCTDLAVFKAFFNRSRDWADLEEMIAAGSLDPERVLGVLARYLGPRDPRVGRFRALTT